MNKWMKNGMIGLALTTASVATAVAADKNPAPADVSEEQLMIDGQDFAGGSKLKDRMMMVQGAPRDISIVTLQA